MYIFIFLLQKENVNEDILKVGEGIAAVEIDLMQPIDPNKTPKVHIPTLNHIGLWVDNLDNAVIELTSSNIIFTPGGIRKGACKFNKIKMMYFILVYIYINL